MSKKLLLISFVVSLGGFLFGFDAGIISGVMSYVGPEFDLTDAQIGWVVSAPSWAAMIAMILSGRLSDGLGRKNMLLLVALLYSVSALLSAYATNYEMLSLARMIGGLAFGSALILAPMYIAEISTAGNRGILVSIQQLNIVLGFFAAFLSNYFFNKYNGPDYLFLNDENVWRWMLGVELFPALLYFLMLLIIPQSPRWLYTKNKFIEAKQVLSQIHGKQRAEKEISSIEKRIENEKGLSEVKWTDILKPSFRFILIVGLAVGILQQITGINAIYFYATSIFKQTGIGTDAAFSSGILLSTVTLVFTCIAMYLIDRVGRRPLMLVGTAGIAISLLLCSFGFSQARYKLTLQDISEFKFENSQNLIPFAGKIYANDVIFKEKMKTSLGSRTYNKNDGILLEAATKINATLVLAGILGFIACFAFSLGPVMWVLLSELYPIRYRGIAIGIIAFVNSFISSAVQLIFPWELSNLGNYMTFFIFGAIAVAGFFVLLKILPETKGKSLEELETTLIK